MKGIHQMRNEYRKKWAGLLKEKTQGEARRAFLGSAMSSGAPTFKPWVEEEATKEPEKKDPERHEENLQKVLS